jgi:Sulfotransferase family
VRLKFWQRDKPAGPALPATRLFTTGRYPIYYLFISKCGCTFIKNLLYAIDHGAQHSAGNAIHAHDRDLVHARAGDEAAIRQSPYAFTVLRDPVDRFVSFYFDKVYSGDHKNLPALRARLVERHGLDLSPGLPAEGHRENVRILLRWVESALNARHKESGHRHWKRQSTLLHRARTYRLEMLTLDGLDRQLPALLSPLIADIKPLMDSVTARNAAAKPVSKADVLDSDLQNAIDAVYANDRVLHDRAAAGWASRLPVGE